MNIELLAAAIRVRQTGSIARAAHAMDVDPSTLSRRISGLERSLGLRLFERTTRQLRVTEAGARYLDRVAPLVEDLDAAREEAQGAATAPSGHLRMTASVAFAAERIVPVLPDFRAQFPDITIDLIPSDAALGLVEEGLDLAVRLGARPSGDAISTRLHDTRYRVVAAESWCARNAMPGHPADLSGLDCLRFALPEFRDRWLFRRDPDSEIVPVPIGGGLSIGNALALRDSCHLGMGPALLPDWLIARALAEWRLVDLLPDWDCAATSFDTAAWLLFPARRHLPRKSRVMIDFLRKALGRS